MLILLLSFAGRAAAPMRAGMTPGLRTSTDGSCTVPRARGDGSRYRDEIGNLELLPVPGGMVPTPRPAFSAARPASRVCGDDPASSGGADWAVTCSPHARGWSRDESERDVGQALRTVVQPDRCSPLARGWTRPPRGGGLVVRLLPAPAGRTLGVGHLRLGLRVFSEPARDAPLRATRQPVAVCSPSVVGMALTTGGSTVGKGATASRARGDGSFDVWVADHAVCSPCPCGDGPLNRRLANARVGCPPRLRGGFPRQPAGPAGDHCSLLSWLLPALAGMDLCSTSGTICPAAAPRLCGGWIRSGDDALVGARPLPAPVGMAPARCTAMAVAGPAPRVRGDGPKYGARFPFS